MKEERRKNVYLSTTKKQEIVKEFLKNMKTGEEFGRKELKEFLLTFDWFIGLPKSVKTYRIEDFVNVMKEKFGKNLKQVNKDWKPGEEIKWSVVSDFDNDDTEVVPPEAVKPMEKHKRRCSVEKLKKFYIVIKKASSKIGISKKDVEKIMGYEATMTVQSINSINDQIENETGFRPLVVDKKHIFVNYDILRVDKDIAEVVLEDLKEKLGSEPEIPTLENDYESIVKFTIKKDYQILSMFANSNTILHQTKDMDRFRDSIVAKTVTLGIEKVVEIFRENLVKRYEIENLDFICRPRKYIAIADTENNPKIKQALMRIEQIFAEYFCEDIVDPERTVWEKELKKENTPNEQEQAQLNMIEYAIFNGQSGEMFLSDIWKWLTTVLNVTPGWDILSLLKKSKKFDVRYESNSDGNTEYLVSYQAPEKEKEEVLEKAEDKKPIETETEIHLINEDQKCKIIAAFKEKMDIEYFCRNGLKKGNIEIHNDELIVEIEYDRTVKESVRSFLKLYYASLRSESISVFFVKEAVAKELEELY